MNKNHKKVIQYLFFFSLTVVLLWFSFKDIKWVDLWSGIRSANYGWVAASVLIGVVAYFVRAQRWRLLIQPLEHSPSLQNTYRAVIIGYLANFVFPRLGEIARCGALTKSNQIPFEKLVGTVVVERALDFICLIVIVVVTFFLKLDTFGKFIQENFIQKVAQVQFSTWFFVLIGLALVITAAALFLQKKKNNAFTQKVKQFLQGVLEGLKTFMHMERRREFVLHTVLLWVCYWIMSWTILYALPGTAHLTPADGLVVMLLGSFGVVAPTSGGLGAFHAILKIGMPALFVGVSEADALTFATLSHESQMLFIVILGLIAYLQVFVFLKKPQKEN